MLNLRANQSIGIFDSGIGGLTVAKSLIDELPNESIIYFGDTLHLPYGDKSAKIIRGYTKKIIDFLLEQNVKLILVACNSVSAAYSMLRDYIGADVPLVNVIDPAINFLNKNYVNKRVGLIGTKLTLDSKIYHKKLSLQKSNISLHALATPLLVPLIEEGFYDHKIMNVALKMYLSDPELQGIEALILGCTHYQIIRTKIADFYHNAIEIIDTTKVVASAVKQELMIRKLLSVDTKSHHMFYVSDDVPGFARQVKLFFGKEIIVKVLNLF
ncbi:MAG: glutamate racemase [Coxiellaceae bacterium]|jgi:glutamate racemase|nr:glutamate racemase [Coxiellaceae bacterium]